MESENTSSAGAAVDAVAGGARCDECAAPVDAAQRYCVVCGAHRRHVNDPATRYLSQLSARSRTNRAAVTARRRPRRSGMRGLGIAVALALVPAIAAIGVLAGRSSNRDDAHLIQALSRQQAALAHANAAAAQTTTTAPQAVADSGASTKQQTPSKKKQSKNRKRGGDRQNSSATAGAGAAPPVSAAKATAKQKATGAAVTDKVQKSEGKSYVHQQSGLPGTVVVP